MNVASKSKFDQESLLFLGFFMVAVAESRTCRINHEGCEQEQARSGILALSRFLHGDNCPMGYAIRRATVGDAATIARQRVGMFRDMPAPLSEADAASVFDASRDQLAPMLESGEYVGWIAELDGEPVAGAGLFIHRLLPRAGLLDHPCEAYVVNVFTEHAHRRRGLARQLMTTLIEWSRAQQIRRVTLHASDTGRLVYEQMGFKPTNEFRLDLR
jgi:GNAT superfamily N-acetyltransferase